MLHSLFSILERSFLASTRAFIREHMGQNYPEAKRRTALLNLLLMGGVFVIVFASRLPFLNLGYGVDADAWRIARAGLKMASNGEYVCSRAPCYPLPEITYWLLSPTKDYIFNGITAFLSALGALAFAGAIKRIGGRDFLISALAFAFVPVIYVNSTNSMDYLWSSSLTLIALYFVVRSNPLPAGVFLGLAIGTRITAGAMVVPLGLLLCVTPSNKHTRQRKLAYFLLASGAVSFAFFLPVYLKMGWSFLSFVDNADQPFHVILGRATLDVWGLLGIFAILIGLAALALQVIASRTSWKNWLALTPQRKVWGIACILVVVIYVMAFIRLPLEAGYLIPIVPFVIGFFELLVHRVIYLLLCGLLVASPFFWDATLSTNPNCSYQGFKIGNEPHLFVCLKDQASIIAYYNYRKKFNDQNDRVAKKIVEIASQTNEQVVVVAGIRAVMLNIKYKGILGDNVKVEYLLKREKIHNYKKAKVKLVALSDARLYNRSTYGVDLKKEGALIIGF